MIEPRPRPSDVQRIQLNSVRDLLRIVSRHAGKGFLTMVALSGLTILAAQYWPRRFESEAKLLVKVGRQSVALDPITAMNARGGITLSRDAELKAEIEILKSQGLAADVVGALGVPFFVPESEIESPEAENIALEELSDHLRVQAANELVITVAYRGKTIDDSQRVVTTLVDRYLKKRIDVHSDPGSLSFFSGQISVLEKEIRKLELQRQTYKDEQGVFAVEEQHRAASARLVDLKHRSADAEFSLAASEAKIKALGEALGAIAKALQESGPLPGNVPNSLETRLAELQLREMDLLKIFNENSDTMKRLREQIERLAQIVKTGVTDNGSTTAGLQETQQNLEIARLTETATAAAQRSSLAVLGKQLVDERAVFRKMETHRQELLRISNKIEELTGNLTRYREAREQARINGALDEERLSNVVMFQPATRPITPAGPPKLWLFLVGFVVAAFSAGGVVLLAEFADDSLRTANRARQRLGAPVVGTLRRGKGLASAFKLSRRRKKGFHGSMDKAAGKDLRTMAELVGNLVPHTDTRGAVIGVMTDEPGHGGSTVALHLATAIAAHRGERVLILDGNSTDRTLTRGFESDPERADREDSPYVACQPEGLYRLATEPSTNGTVTSNGAASNGAASSNGTAASSRQGNGARSKGVLTSNGTSARGETPASTALRHAEEFPFVVVDLPAMSVAGVPAHAGQYDALLFVVDARQSHWQTSRESLELLDSAGVTRVGVVLNRLRNPVLG